MTPEDVRKEVAQIKYRAGDDEAAHSMEDKLHQDVLLAIAEGRCADPAACAREALATRSIEFSRWYA